MLYTLYVTNESGDHFIGGIFDKRLNDTEIEIILREHFPDDFEDDYTCVYGKMVPLNQEKIKMIQV